MASMLVGTSGGRKYLGRKARFVFMRYSLALENEKDLVVLINLNLWCEFYFGVDADIVVGYAVFLCEIALGARRTLGIIIAKVPRAGKLTILAPRYILPLRRHDFIYIGSLRQCVSLLGHMTWPVPIYISKYSWINRYKIVSFKFLARGLKAYGVENELP